MSVTSIELYNLLRGKLGDKEAQVLTDLETSQVEKKFSAKEDILLTVKDKNVLLTKDDAYKIFATKQDLAKTKSDIIKWMFIFWSGSILTTLGGLFAFLKLFLNK